MISNDTLEVILVTYNRKKFLKRTLEYILDDINSPIRHLDITILDNNSNDGTFELIKNYQAEFPNLKYIKNPCNIGGGANVVKAFTLAGKKYIWVLCDDDTYDFEGFEQIEKAIEEDYDVIFTRYFDKNITTEFINASFVPACIYKSKHITETVICNMYDNISNMFPHLSLMAKCVNNKNKIFIPQKEYVKNYMGNYDAHVFLRGYNINDYIPLWRRNMFLDVGILNSLYLIESKEKRKEYFLKHVCYKNCKILKYINEYLRLNYLVYNNSIYNIVCLFSSLFFLQKFVFLYAFLILYIKAIFYYHFCNKKFLFMQNDEKWDKYLKFVDEQKYIDKLAKKYKDKKILIYGAGTIAEHIFNNYDLSKLNIVAVSDKKYTSTSKYKGYVAISPDEIKDLNPDVILFTLYNNKIVKKYFKEQKISAKMEDMIKRECYILI